MGKGNIVIPIVFFLLFSGRSDVQLIKMGSKVLFNDEIRIFDDICVDKYLYTVYI